MWARQLSADEFYVGGVLSGKWLFAKFRFSAEGMVLVIDLRVGKGLSRFGMEPARV